VGNIIYLAFGQMVNQPWDAPDFMDNQKSSNLQEEGNSKALEAKQSEKLEEAKRKESEAGLEIQKPNKKEESEENRSQN